MEESCGSHGRRDCPTERGEERVREEEVEVVKRRKEQREAEEDEMEEAVKREGEKGATKESAEI